MTLWYDYSAMELRRMACSGTCIVFLTFPSHRLRRMACSGTCIVCVPFPSRRLTNGCCAHQEEITYANRSCPAGHGLKELLTPMDGYTYSKCSTEVPKGTKLYSCRACNHDECVQCPPRKAFSSHWPECMKAPRPFRRPR